MGRGGGGGALRGGGEGRRVGLGVRGGGRRGGSGRGPTSVHITITVSN